MENKTGEADRSFEFETLDNLDISTGKVKDLNRRNSYNFTQNEEDNEGITDMKFDFEDSVANDTADMSFIVSGSDSHGNEKSDIEKAVPATAVEIAKSVKIIDNEDFVTSSETDSGKISADSRSYIKKDEDSNITADISESLEIAQEMSEILNTKLSFKSLQLCCQLIDAGAEHTALADLLKNWRQKRAPKPQRVLGHFFDAVPKNEKKDWVW